MREGPGAMEVAAWVAGGAAGGLVGHLLYGWILNQGFYAPMLPGALIGLGCGLTARRPSFTRGVLCGIAALALGFFTEWRYFPWDRDPGLGYFVANLHKLQPLTLILVPIGAAIAFYLGKDGGLRRRSV